MLRDRRKDTQIICGVDTFSSSVYVTWLGFLCESYYFLFNFLIFPFTARQRHTYKIGLAYFHIISHSKINPFLTNLVRETPHSLTISTWALLNTNPPHVLWWPDMCSYNRRVIRAEFCLRSLVQRIPLECLFVGVRVIWTWVGRGKLANIGVEGTGSISCPVGGLCVNAFELSDPASRLLVSVVVPCVQSAGYALAQLVEAVCFNPAGCGFVSRWNL